jgi:hypothetical protein
MKRLVLMGLLAAATGLAGCADKKPPAPPPVPVPAAPEPTNIVMEPSDLEAFTDALRRATAKGNNQDEGWANSATGKRGSVKMLRSGFDAGNRTCREFHSLTTLGRLFKHQTGMICRGADQVWEIVRIDDYPVYRAKE